MSVVYTFKSVGVLSGTKSWLPLHRLFCNCSEIWFSNQQSGSIVLSESGRHGHNPNLFGSRDVPGTQGHQSSSEKLPLAVDGAETDMLKH